MSSLSIACINDPIPSLKIAKECDRVILDLKFEAQENIPNNILLDFENLEVNLFCIQADPLINNL